MVQRALATPNTGGRCLKLTPTVHPPSVVNVLFPGGQTTPGGALGTVLNSLLALKLGTEERSVYAQGRVERQKTLLEALHLITPFVHTIVTSLVTPVIMFKLRATKTMESRSLLPSPPTSLRTRDRTAMLRVAAGLL